MASDKKSCLKQEADGFFHLDHSHAYYYQIQTQIFISQVEYCDFYICTFPCEGQPSLHMSTFLLTLHFGAVVWSHQNIHFPGLPSPRTPWKMVF